MIENKEATQKWHEAQNSGGRLPELHCKGCGYYPVVNDGRHRDDCTCIFQVDDDVTREQAIANIVNAIGISLVVSDEP